MPFTTIYKDPFDLNETLPYKELPQLAKDGFAGIPKRVKLEKGFRLYKFSEHNLVTVSQLGAVEAVVERGELRA